MKKKKSISYAKWGYIFILPFFITFLIFSLIPLVDTVRYSFYEYYRSGIKEIGPNFIGIANYLSLLKSDMLKYSTNTLISVDSDYYICIDKCASVAFGQDEYFVVVFDMQGKCFIRSHVDVAFGYDDPSGDFDITAWTR